MYHSLGIQVWIAIINAVEEEKMSLTHGWGEVDQLTYPGQEWVEVGWSSEEDAPRLFIYRSSGHPTSRETGELVVERRGNWDGAGFYPGRCDDGYEPLTQTIERLSDLEKTLQSECICDVCGKLMFRDVWDDANGYQQTGPAICSPACRRHVEAM